MSALSHAHLHCEDAAFAYLEAKLWPEGPVCPHCGSVNAKHYDLSKTRRGLRKCADKQCRMACCRFGGHRPKLTGPGSRTRQG